MIGCKRKLSLGKYYKGSGWFSLNKSAARILVDAMNNEAEMRKGKIALLRKKYLSQQS